MRSTDRGRRLPPTVGIAGGSGEGLLFRKGEIVKKVPQERLVDELFALIEDTVTQRALHGIRTD